MTKTQVNGVVPSYAVHVHNVLEIPAYQQINLMNGGCGYMDAVIKAGLSHHFLINVPLRKAQTRWRYGNLFLLIGRKAFKIMAYSLRSTEQFALRQA
jgi:hypothetical protein